MELNQLIQFRVIAECRTLTQAAEKLYISQPALSTMLKKLEDELGVRLFDRTRNKISLNEAGELALKHAIEILSQVERMKTDLREFSHKDHIFKVGFCDPGPMWYCSPRFSMIHPDIELKSSLYSKSEDEISLLLNQTNDILISSKILEHPDIISKPFVEELLLLSVPATSPLARLSQINLRDAELPQMVLFSAEGAFWKNQQPLYDALESRTKLIRCEDYFVFNQLVRNTESATITTKMVRHYRDDGAGRVLIPITDFEAYIHYHISYLKENKGRLDPFLAWAEFCSSQFEQTQ